MRKRLIDIGIICIIIGMISELILKNYLILVMIIPLIYLISVRKSLSNNDTSDDIKDNKKGE